MFTTELQALPEPEWNSKYSTAVKPRALPSELAKLALVIEDSIAGIEAAKSAGLACIAVTHSYGASELTRAGADLAVENLDEISEEQLVALFKQLHG